MNNRANLFLLIAVLLWILGMALGLEDLYKWAGNNHVAQVILATILIFASLVINEFLSRKNDNNKE